MTEAPVTDHTNDPEVREYVIEKVREGKDGWEVLFGDGFITYIDSKFGVEPKVGSTMRRWGKQFGSLRGLMIDGKLAFYRTPAEEELFRETEMYGADAKEWLERWDAGHGVWTVTLGGLSASYDQCINIVVAETVRIALQMESENSGVFEINEGSAKTLDERLTKAVDSLGLSGSQYGVGKSFGVQLFIHGPVAAIKKYPTERRTQASQAWPILNLSREDMLLAAAALDSARGTTTLESGDLRRVAERFRQLGNLGKR